MKIGIRFRLQLSQIFKKKEMNKNVYEQKRMVNEENITFCLFAITNMADWYLILFSFSFHFLSMHDNDMLISTKNIHLL